MDIRRRIAERQVQWDQLEARIGRSRSGRLRRPTPEGVLDLARLYRSACADLALASAYHLPTRSVAFLHQLVGRAHSAVYRGQRFRVGRWGELLLSEMPRRLLRDRCLWLAFLLFWGPFLVCLYAAYTDQAFARTVVGAEMLGQVEDMYAEPIGGQRGAGGDADMFGFYILNNTGIGIRCFAMGALAGVGSLVIELSNAIQLGTLFGHMLSTPQAGNFREFVTAHGPLELNAIVLAAAAGLRLGFAFVATDGHSRLGSMRRQAPRALEMVCLAAVMFVLAAFVEGFVSAARGPYEFKVAVAAVSTLVIVTYLGVLGLRPAPVGSVAVQPS